MGGFAATSALKRRGRGKHLLRGLRCDGSVNMAGLYSNMVYCTGTMGSLAYGRQVMRSLRWRLGGYSRRLPKIRTGLRRRLSYTSDQSVTRRKLQTPGNAEEHKRQEAPTINPIGPTNKPHRSKCSSDANACRPRRRFERSAMTGMPHLRCGRHVNVRDTAQRIPSRCHDQQ